MTLMFRNMSPLSCLLAASLLLVPKSASAQGGIPLWTNYFGGVGNSVELARALAVDKFGNVFVTGAADAFGGYSFATIKYSSEGVALWTNRYGGPVNGGGDARAIAVDGNGNIFVLGISGGIGGSRDYATVGYSGGGTPLWTNRWTRYGSGIEVVSPSPIIATDANNGNIYIAGTTADEVNTDFVVIAYSNTGISLWTNHHGANVPLIFPSRDYPSALTVGKNGNVYVTGYSDGDFATVAYSSSGTALWTNRYDGPVHRVDYATAIAVDSSNNVFVTGASKGGGGYYDYATIAYSAGGVPLWTNRFDGLGSYDDEARAIAVDKSGNVYVTGSSTAFSSDFVTIAYSNSGVPLWTNTYNGPYDDNDEPNAIAVDRHGNVYVTGSSQDESIDCATVAYSASGVPLWTNRYDGIDLNEDEAFGIAVDDGGNVYIAGVSSIDGLSQDFLTIKYAAQSLSPIPLQIDKSGSGVVLRWTNAAFNLQSAPFTTGTFSNVHGATSPHTNQMSGYQQYFRLIY